ncbi:MAG TPA: tetratricopeptide repeat protein, partial [Tenuifilaceae bacterium]|nr:tetratricopeptide repeat protein [Tenuifilaceae bacterium]
MKRVILIFWQLLVAFLLFSIATTKAQETDYRTIFSDAEYYFLFNDFAEALPLYQKALEQKPDNANLQYRIGLCYLNTPGEKHKAIPYLEQAVQNITPTYLEGSYKETKAPKNAYFYLGEAYRVVENIDKAIGAYSTFRELIDTKDVYSLDYVDQQIEAC